jgi:hypothetical protein
MFLFCLKCLVYYKLPAPGLLSFSNLGKFSATILLNILSMPLDFMSSHSSILMTHRFYLFMVSHVSCTFHLWFFSIFCDLFTV